MSLETSSLSIDKRGYDLIVSTTQARINTSLLAYLEEGSHSEAFICFLVDPRNGKPSTQVPLDNLIRWTNGVNPFQIPAGTPHDDPRIQALTKALFAVGIHLRVGIPSGIQPFDLPPVITLGNSVNDVELNLLFSKFTIVQNAPPMWGQPGSWDVWQQPLVGKEPWHIRMRVGIVEDDISDQLNTTYFKKHPDVRNQVRKQLHGASPTSSFDFRQLVLDVDNAATPLNPVLKGVPRDSNAYAIFQSPLFNVSRHCPSVQTTSLPPVSVMMVATSSRPSPFQPTGYDLQISHPSDTMGMMRREMATLNYLCATGHHPLQSHPGLDCNWSEPLQLTVDGGVIVVNRDLISKYVMDEILPQAKRYCIKPRCRVIIDEHGAAHYSTVMSPGQTPQIATTNHTGTEVIQIEYHGAHATSEGGGGARGNTDLRLRTSYTCSISFIGSTVVIKQHLLYAVYMHWNRTIDSINALDRTIMNVLGLEVDEAGSLKVVQGKCSTEDHSESPNNDASVHSVRQMSQVIHGLGIGSSSFDAISLGIIPLNQVQNFIFPQNSKLVLTSAKFSKNQDLICGTALPPPNKTASRVSSSDETAATYALNQTPPISPSRNPRHSLSLICTADMMENRIHGRALSPYLKIEALQTKDGHALLFAMDKDSKLWSVVEKNGENRTGWEDINITPRSLSDNDPLSTGVVHTFDVGQSVGNGAISLAIAVKSGDTDRLYISLNNPSDETSWISNIDWTHIPFDAEGEDFSPSLSIAGIMFAETTGTGGHEHLVIDIESPEAPTSGEIVRYHISQRLSKNGKRWVRDPEHIQVNDGKYQSCVGRPKSSDIDGIYTTGTSALNPLLIWVPVSDMLGSQRSEALRLQLPDKGVPTAIAPVRKIDPDSGLFGPTDLYVVIGDELWRYAADTQINNTGGQSVLKSELFSKTRHLTGMEHNGVTTIWGRNDDGHVYYTSSKTVEIAQGARWTVPLPLLVHIERISAYINRTDGGNTIFAADEEKMVKMIQATDTDDKMWKTQDIMVEAQPLEKSIPFNSFTTHVRVTNKDKLPVHKTPLLVSTDNRTAVYINGKYYVIGRDQMKISTDIMGSLTIIETTDDIHCAILRVSIQDMDGETIINPMENMVDRLKDFETAESLRNIKIPTRFVAGGFLDDHKREPLITDENPEEVENVAQIVANLRKAYKQASPTEPPTSLRDLNSSSEYYSFWSRVTSTLGDVAQAAKSAWQKTKDSVSTVVNAVEDGTAKVWKATVHVGEQTWHVFLKTCQATLSVMTIAWNKLKKGVRTIIQCIRTLFSWDDIKRTKDVMTNMTRLYLEHQVDKISEVRTPIDKDIESVQEELHDWANGDDISHMDEIKNPASNETSVANHTSTSLFLANHFRDNVKDISITHVPVSATSDIAEVLIQSLSSEEEALGSAYNDLENLAASFGSKSVVDVLKEAIGILGVAALKGARVVVDALLNVLSNLGHAAIDLLDVKLHIPIISDILNAIGVADISFLDLFMWIAAVGYTVVYKLAKNNEPPFPNNSDSDLIINASKWEDLQRPSQASEPTSWYSAYTQGPTADQAAIPPPGISIIPDHPDLKKTLYIAGHTIAGFFLFTCSFVTPMEAGEPANNNALGIASAVIGIIVGSAQGSADALSPKDVIKNSVVSDISIGITLITLAFKGVFSGLGQSALGTMKKPFPKATVNDPRATGATVNAALVIPAMFCTCWHCYEFGREGPSAKRSAGILGEVTNMTQYVSRIAYFAAVTNPESLEATGPIMAAANFVGAGLQTAEALVDPNDE